MQIKETLRNKLKNFFGSTIYYRGLNYYRRGLEGDLEILEGNHDIVKIKAKVNSTRIYDSAIFFDMDSLDFVSSDCNCPYYDDCMSIPINTMPIK